MLHKRISRKPVYPDQHSWGTFLPVYQSSQLQYPPAVALTIRPFPQFQFREMLVAGTVQEHWEEWKRDAGKEGTEGHRVSRRSPAALQLQMSDKVPTCARITRNLGA